MFQISFTFSPSHEILKYIPLSQKKKKAKKKGKKKIKRQHILESPKERYFSFSADIGLITKC